MGTIKTIKIPDKINEEIAELVGILFGDGELCKGTNNSYYLRFSFNSKKERKYASFVNSLLFRNFKIFGKRSTNQKKNCITLQFYSKRLTEYFHDVVGVSYSPKKLEKIPDCIKNDNSLSKAFVRGLFDADGCVTVQKQGKYRYSLVKICSANFPFLCVIKKLILGFGINSFICKKKDRSGNYGFDLVMRNKEAKRFFGVVGSNNPNNTKKWKQNGAAGI